MLKRILAALALFFAMGEAWACSLMPFSQEFTIDGRGASGARALDDLTIESVQFVPWLSGGDSCDGAGWLTVDLSSAKTSANRLRRQGYIIRAVSGVNDTDFFPAYPLAFLRRETSRNTLYWGWTGITPDDDGHVRWTLEIVPVSRSGVQGEPMPLCVSSDGSCPERHSPP